MASIDISKLTLEELYVLQQRIINKQKIIKLHTLFNFSSDSVISDACFVMKGQPGDLEYDLDFCRKLDLDSNVLFVYTANVGQLCDWINGKQPSKSSGSSCIADSQSSFPIVTCHWDNSNDPQRPFLKGFESLTQIVYIGKVKMTVENLIDFNFNWLSTHFKDSSFIHMRVPKDPNTKLLSSFNFQVGPEVLDYINKKLIELNNQFFGFS